MTKRVAEFLVTWEQTDLTGVDVKKWVKEWMAYVLSGGVRPPHPH